MEDFSTIRDVIDAWPTRQCFADDVKVPIGRVHKWAQSCSIPPKHFAPIIRAAAERQIALDADTLVRLAEVGRGETHEDAA